MTKEVVGHVTSRPASGSPEDRLAYHLRIPPGNKLEALRGNRKGSHSIRINDQWRVVFVWKGPDRIQLA